MNRKLEPCTTTTPWGKAQDKSVYGRGVICYSTPGHGGFHVSKGLNPKVPEPIRQASGWYEEDCEWAFVALRFPEVFPPEAQEHALMVCEHYYSDQYAAGLAEITL